MAQSTALTKFTNKVRCDLLHNERAAAVFTMCVDCRRPLFPFPKNKCKTHAVYCWPYCFTVEEIAELALERNGRAAHQ